VSILVASGEPSLPRFSQPVWPRQAGVQSESADGCADGRESSLSVRVLRGVDDINGSRSQVCSRDHARKSIAINLAVCGFWVISFSRWAFTFSGTHSHA
jgi:hypothetical protein